MKIGAGAIPFLRRLEDNHLYVVHDFLCDLLFAGDVSIVQLGAWAFEAYRTL